VALLSLLLNTARIKEPRAALVQTRRTGPTSSCPVKIEEPRCPLGHRCESCGAERDDLAVSTAATLLGVLCLTLCPRCNKGMVGDPPITTDTAGRLVRQHCHHLGCTGR